MGKNFNLIKTNILKLYLIDFRLQLLMLLLLFLFFCFLKIILLKLDQLYCFLKNFKVSTYHGIG